MRLEDIAKITPGFVGADLANLLNEAAILAARKASDTITMEDLDEAVDKIGMGLGQKGKIIKPEEKRLLAYHEAGHAVMTELTPGADPVHKVTIIPRGEAGGFMMPLPEEKLVTTSKEMLAEIKVLFGGRAAEDLVLDDISTGAYSDIKRATRLARAYVESVGMSKKLGPVNLENSDEEFTFTSNKSNETIREIDLEIRQILNDEYRQTVETLRENRAKLDGIAELLLKKETITGDEVRKIISGVSVQELLDNSEKKDSSDSENKQESKTEEIKNSENASDNNSSENNSEEAKSEEIETEEIATEETKPEKVENNENFSQENNITSEHQEVQHQNKENTENIQNAVNLENNVHQENQEVKDNHHEFSGEKLENSENIQNSENTENVKNDEAVNNTLENSSETVNATENVFEKNSENNQKDADIDNGTEELKVDTDNFSGISEEFPREEVKTDVNKSDKEKKDDNNDGTSVKEEKKEKKIEIPSFMR